VGGNYLDRDILHVLVFFCHTFVLYWVSMVVFRNVTWSMGHSPVNMMVWCYLLIVGEVSVVYLAVVPDYKDIINVSPPYALFCCCPVEHVLLQVGTW